MRYEGFHLCTSDYRVPAMSMSRQGRWRGKIMTRVGGFTHTHTPSRSRPMPAHKGERHRSGDRERGVNPLHKSDLLHCFSPGKRGRDIQNSAVGVTPKDGANPKSKVLQRQSPSVNPGRSCGLESKWKWRDWSLMTLLQTGRAVTTHVMKCECVSSPIQSNTK